MSWAGLEAGKRSAGMEPLLFPSLPLFPCPVVLFTGVPCPLNPARGSGKCCNCRSAHSPAAKWISAHFQLENLANRDCETVFLWAYVFAFACIVARIGHSTYLYGIYQTRSGGMVSSRTPNSITLSGRRQVRRSWSQTCSELEFGPSSSSLASIASTS